MSNLIQRPQLKEKYDNYISIEMKSGSEIEKIKDIIEYTQDVFKN